MPSRTFDCVRCGQSATRSSQGRRPPFCFPCSRERMQEAQAAHGAVASAIIHKRLEKPCQSACVDCGRPAEQYDHRDYARPLDVEPVCKSCNTYRGHAFDSRYRPKSEVF